MRMFFDIRSTELYDEEGDSDDYVGMKLDFKCYYADSDSVSAALHQNRTGSHTFLNIPPSRDMLYTALCVGRAPEELELLSKDFDWVHEAPRQIALVVKRTFWDTFGRRLPEDKSAYLVGYYLCASEYEEIVDGEDSDYIRGEYIPNFKKCASDAPIMIDSKIRTCPEGFAYWFELKFLDEIISAMQELPDYNRMTAKFCGYDSSVLLKDVQRAFLHVEKSKATASVVKRDRMLLATFDLIFNEARNEIRSSLTNKRLFSRLNALDLSTDPIVRFQLRVPLIGDKLSNFVLPRSLNYLDLNIYHTSSSFRLAFPVDLSEFHPADQDSTAMPKPMANVSSPKKAKTRQHRKSKKSKDKDLGTNPLPIPPKKPKAEWQRKATASLKNFAEAPILESPAFLIHSHMKSRAPN